MIGALIIVFREVIEAGLVVGIVLAVTRDVAGSRLWTLGGVAGGIAGSCLVAAFTGTLASLFAGSGQEIFNASILAIAVAMLAWHNIWMARHGRLVHHATIFEMNVESYRRRAALERKRGPGRPPSRATTKTSS